MKRILERMESRLERLENQNEIIRKELHVIRSGANSANSFALLEAKTSREVVEEIQFDVKSLNAKLTSIERSQQVQAEMISKIMSKLRFVEVDDDEEMAEVESDEEFRVVEIRSKTWEKEQNWLKGKFHETRAVSAIVEGTSFQGRTLENISNSIPLSGQHGTSCVLKLSNHLNVALTDPQFHYWPRTKMTGPSAVAAHFTEVFVGSGSYCCFLYSFSISDSLRMILLCGNDWIDRKYFIIGFKPQNVPTDRDLYWKLRSMELSPDLYGNKFWCGIGPIELFVTTGQFLVRGHMKTNGRRGFVEVDIFDLTHPTSNGSLISFSSENMSSSLKRAAEKISRNFKTSEGFHEEISCSVEIFNLLNVRLRSEDTFYLSSRRSNFKSIQIKPFEGAAFFASDDMNVEGMISFQIESTDLSLVVAFKTQEKENRFAGAFIPRPATPASKQEMEKLLSDKHWKSHEWRKSAQGKDGEQVLQIRNIRAVISITEDKKWLLKIQVFAF